MAHDRRNEWQNPRREHERDRRGPPRGARYPSGDDRDRYETGGERRYWPDWERDYGEEGSGYEGDRSYSAGGYGEEFGYRSNERAGPYERFARHTGERDESGDEYFGAGSHYGGGFGSAPGARASGAGTHGAPGYARENVWTDRSSDWLPASGGGRGSRGGYQRGGAHGGDSRAGGDYGQSFATRDFERSYAHGEREPEQSFRGRGPKGYRRSDARLKEIICERLADDPRIDPSDVEIDVQKQIAKLSGTVPDRRTKYAIEDLVEHCGVEDIDNQLRVAR